MNLALVLSLMKLLLDLGNTRLKSAYTDDHTLIPLTPLQHQHADFLVALQLQWQALPCSPTLLAISCVGRVSVLHQLLNLARQYWPSINIFIPKAQAVCLGVRNAYHEPEKLGIDRWLALLAARQMYQEPVAIIDCGTAITLDFLASDGLHLGGMICPGLTLMKRSLAVGTEQLPQVAHQQFTSLANSTETAINSGVLNAAAGLIERVIHSHTSPCKLIFSGGDAELLAAEINLPSIIYPELVMLGLLALSQQNDL